METFNIKKTSYIYIAKKRFWFWKAVEKVKIKEIIKVDSRWQQHKVCGGRWEDDSFLGISSHKQRTASAPLSALCWCRCRMKSNWKQIPSISSFGWKTHWHVHFIQPELKIQRTFVMHFNANLMRAVQFLFATRCFVFWTWAQQLRTTSKTDGNKL